MIIGKIKIIRILINNKKIMKIVLKRILKNITNKLMVKKTNIFIKNLINKIIIMSKIMTKIIEVSLIDNNNI